MADQPTKGVRVACPNQMSHLFVTATSFAVEAETDILYVYRDTKTIAVFKTWDHAWYAEER